MSSKAPIQRTGPPTAATIPGKWLIIGVVTVALIGAVGSWIFRYYATRQVAGFWGPCAAIIRDAPSVRLLDVRSFESASPTIEEVEATTDHSPAIDVSKARGMAHLRNALLEDRNYDWPAKQVEGGDRWRWALVFTSVEGKPCAVLFSQDCTQVAAAKNASEAHRKLLSTKIATGLREMFEEMSADSVPDTEAR